MKRLFYILCLISVLSLAACGNKKATVEEPVPETSAVTATTAAVSAAAEAEKPPVETIAITAPDGSIITETVGEAYIDEPIDVDRLPKGYAGADVGLTAKKWKETTMNIATMVLNDDGTGVFENSDVHFVWYYENDILTLHYVVNLGNVTPTTFMLTSEDGKLTLKEATNDGAVFVQE